MKAKKSEKKQPDAKDLLIEIRGNNEALYEEISSFVKLLEESGVTSYRLTASIQDPIITNYSIC